MERLTDKDKHILCQKLCDMKRRCNNPDDRNYKDYGGRGIKVCDEWSDSKNGHRNFQKWAIENGWRKGLSIDRKNNDGDYEPSNCRWSTSKQQSNNTRFNRLVTINGKTKTVQEWADIVGISQRAMTGRIEAGWSEEDLLKPKYKPLKMTKAEMSKEIRMWRSLEEQGKLLKLPCEVGQRVYMLYRLCEDAAWEIEEHKIRLEDLGNIGKTVFLTREEAEATLNKLENELPAVYDTDKVEEQKMCECYNKWAFSIAESKVHFLGAEQDTCIVQENNEISACINELELCRTKINYCSVCGRKLGDKVRL